MSAGVSAWQKYTATRIQLGKKGKPDIDTLDMREYNATLLSMCLYREDKTTPVPTAEIVKTFPASMLNKLFDYCQTMNGLNEEGLEQAKKD